MTHPTTSERFVVRPQWHRSTDGFTYKVVDRMQSGKPVFESQVEDDARDEAVRLNQMPQPPTPDAIRAAIETALSDAHHAGYTAAWVEYGTLTKADEKAATERATKSRQHLIAQIGAIPAVGASMSEAATSVLDRETRHMIVDKWLVSRLGFAESAGHIDEVIADLLDELGAVPAAGSVKFRRTRDIPSDDGHMHSFVWDSNSGMYCETCKVRLNFVLANGADDGE